MTQLRPCALAFVVAASLWAQQPAPSAKPAALARSSHPDPGSIREGTYHNPSFGFSYKLPYGWVDRTTNIQDDSPDASRSRVLLAIFERPPQATGNSINSAVVIAAEPVPAGIKTAAEYLDSLAELTTAQGFQSDEESHPFAVGTARLVRADFSKARGTLSMRQASLALLEKGYAVSFTFIGGSAEEVNVLVEKLSFAPPKSH